MIGGPLNNINRVLGEYIRDNDPIHNSIAYIESKPVFHKSSYKSTKKKTERDKTASVRGSRIFTNI